MWPILRRFKTLEFDVWTTMLWKNKRPLEWLSRAYRGICLSVAIAAQPQENHKCVENMCGQNLVDKPRRLCNNNIVPGREPYRLMNLQICLKKIEHTFGSNTQLAAFVKFELFVFTKPAHYFACFWNTFRVLFLLCQGGTRASPTRQRGREWS